MTDELDLGSQFKLQVFFDNDVVAMFRPRRTSRDQQAPPNQVHTVQYDRHTSEIAAYHLDRILGFYRALPTIGRNVNMITEMLRVAQPKLQRTFFVSHAPDENICFTGTCRFHCDSYHPICGNGSTIEVCFYIRQTQLTFNTEMIWFFIFDSVLRDHLHHSFLNFRALNDK